MINKYFLSHKIKILLLVLTSSSFVSPSWNAPQLASHVQESIGKALNDISKLDSEILSVEGLSSNKVRHFLNNLCSLENTRYLEIGVWQGSTFISSLYKNNNIEEAVAIDNWSQFNVSDGPFFNNTSNYLKDSSSFNFYDEDSFAIDISKLFKNKVNIYFYDGDHTEEAQRLAFEYYDQILDDIFIAVVDDYNHIPAQIGTQKAFKNLNYQVLKEWVLPARYNEDSENWWNGLYVAIVQKNPFNTLKKTLPLDMHGWFQSQNKINLELFIDKLKPKKVVEVGSWLGVSAIFMAELLDEDSKIYCVDPWIPYPEMDDMPELQERLKIAYEQFLSNCIHKKVTDKVVPMRMTSLEAHNFFEADIDLVYIDGSHSEENVTLDIKKWYKKLKSGGIICGDDFPHPSVKAAVEKVAIELGQKINNANRFWWYNPKE